jgi:hypothetical protein
LIKLFSSVKDMPALHIKEYLNEKQDPNLLSEQVLATQEGDRAGLLTLNNPDRGCLTLCLSPSQSLNPQDSQPHERQ